MQFIEYQKNYENKTRKSKRWYSRSARIFAGGVNHNIRFFEPYPFVTSAAKGRYLFDVDGNRYTDYWMGHWALILGHSPKPVVKALSEQIKNGILFGTVNDVSIELGELIQKLMPRAENIRFSNTGAEATMYAVRLARAKTGKRVIAKVIGGWHGFNTTLMQTVNYPFEAQEGPGLVDDESQFIESIPFNDLDRSLKVLETVRDDLACIIIEPLLGSAGCIPAVDGYLQGLQEFAAKNDCLFILDEIVTGFRLSLRGATSLYKLEPDIFTIGKIVGGGMPIGAVCGKKEIMSLADPVLRKEKESRCAIGGGTFSANPMTMNAGLATLNYLKENSNRIYTKINKLGNDARSGIAKIFSEAKVDVRVTGTGSLYLMHFLNEGANNVSTATDVAMTNKELLRRYHMALIAKHGIFFLPLKMGAFSDSHDDRNVKNLLSATRSIVDSGILHDKASVTKEI
ncbi:MAG TPA: aspartate aminotransferase family protein [Nitrososphaeraceae archaeon]|nr:aspartate aminotransferase family protein [Nitrososphaeraceae archaeon]